MDLIQFAEQHFAAYFGLLYGKNPAKSATFGFQRNKLHIEATEKTKRLFLDPQAALQMAGWMIGKGS